MPYQNRQKALSTGWKAGQEMDPESQPMLASLETGPEVSLPEAYNTKKVSTNHHLYHIGTGFPLLSDSWDEGYQLKDGIFVGGQWHVVMTEKVFDFESQAMRLRAKWPKDDIQELWDDNYRIARINRENGSWFLIMDKVGPAYAQRWRTRSGFPEEEISKNWKEDYFIKDISYGEELYALILDKKTKEYDTQSWIRRDYFPKKEIQEYWQKGHQITVLKFLNNEWVAVLTKFNTPVRQKWLLRRTYPQQEIIDLENQGFEIHSLAYGQGYWAIVLNKQ